MILREYTLLYGLRSQILSKPKKKKRSKIKKGERKERRTIFSISSHLKGPFWDSFQATMIRDLPVCRYPQINPRYEHSWHVLCWMRQRDWFRERWPLECGFFVAGLEPWKHAPFRPRTALLPRAPILSSGDNCPAGSADCGYRLRKQAKVDWVQLETYPHKNWPVIAYTARIRSGGDTL